MPWEHKFIPMWLMNSVTIWVQCGFGFCVVFLQENLLENTENSGWTEPFRIPYNIHMQTFQISTSLSHFVQSQRRTMPKNVQTTSISYSFHMLRKVMLKILQASVQQYMNQELPDVQAGFRKGRGTRDQITNIHWHKESKGIQERKKYISLSLTMLKPLTVWIITNCGKLLKRWKYQTIYLSAEKPVFG